MAAFFLAATFFFILVTFHEKLHPVLLIYTAEYDGYMMRAHRILQGTWERGDPFHPPLYSILVAGMGVLVKDVFVGAKLVSSIFAALLAWFTYRLGSLCFDRRIGLFALVAVILNPYVIIYAHMATSDMTFSLLALLIVLAVVKMDQKPVLFSALVLPILVSAAFLTRHNTVFLLPLIAIGIFSVPQVSPRKKMGLFMLFLIVVFVLLLPYFFLNQYIFGEPFCFPHYRNLALKIYGTSPNGIFNWDYLMGTSGLFSGWFPVIAHSPKAWLVSFLSELQRFLVDRFPSLLAPGLPGVLLYTVFWVGLFKDMFRTRDRKKWILFSFFSLHVLLLCAFFFTWDRLIMPILPLAYCFVGSLIFSNFYDGWHVILNKGKMRYLSRILAVAVLMTPISGSIRLLAAHVEGHPVREIRALMELEKLNGSDIVVAGDLPFQFLERYVAFDYMFLNKIGGSKWKDYDSFCQALKSKLVEKKVNWVLLTREPRYRETENVFMQKLKQGVPPPFLELVLQDKNFFIYKVRTEMFVLK